MFIASQGFPPHEINTSSLTLWENDFQIAQNECLISAFQTVVCHCWSSSDRAGERREEGQLWEGEGCIGIARGNGMHHPEVEGTDQ